MRFLAFVLSLLTVLAVPAAAQPQPVETLAAQLRQAESDVRAVGREIERPVADEKNRAVLRGRVATARQSAGVVADQLAGELALVDARIAELGPKPADGSEAIEVRNQRARLAAQRLLLDSTIKRARLLTVEAEQTVDQIQRKQVEELGAQLTAHAASPFMPSFWTAVLRSFDNDVRRIGRFLADGERQARARGQQRGVWLAVLGLVAAAALLWPVRRGALRLGQRYLISDAPGHRLRRSANALWRVLVGTVAPLLAAIAIVQGAGWSQLLPPNWGPLLSAFTRAAGFAGFTASVLGALLMRSQPSWRVAPISDAVATRLRPLSWVLAGLTFFGITIDAFNAAVGASAAALGATKAIEAGGSLLLIAGALIALGRVRATAADGEVGHAGIGALALLLWLVVLVAFIALAIGYVEFSLFLVGMIVWATVLGSALYLLLVGTDDAVTTLFSRSSGFGQTLVRGVGVSGSAIDQFGVLLSGTLRIVIALLGIVLLIAPFGAGSGIGAVADSVGAVAGGIQIGGVAISPASIVRGLIVLIVGLALVRAFMGWLERRYLPATDLDNSSRNSVSLIARYVGIAIATIWALASLGIGVERIALLLSALSVGIGFGLQAITQNFVSGLILLTERPIKIGDLIRIGQDEGDVKRISVRSTEIELQDHSTLIVPNSELITKTVLNKTLANPLGRIQIKFSVPIETDADRVAAIVLEAFAAEPAVLDEPPAKVFIEDVTQGRVGFNCLAHVATQRAAYSARSSVLFVLLRRLREEGVEIGSLPQKLEFMPLAGGDGEQTK